MEKVKKDEVLDEELERLKDYGFNIDELMTMLEEEEQNN